MLSSMCLLSMTSNVILSWYCRNNIVTMDYNRPKKHLYKKIHLFIPFEDN